jgi:hypothetical protein
MWSEQSQDNSSVPHHLEDGLNTLTYNVDLVDLKALFTHIKVSQGMMHLASSGQLRK